MSDFSALNTALSGLLAHRRASEVIGQNLANVNTVGYSRQRVDLAAAGGSVVPAIFSRTERPGFGVDVVGTLRMRDEFMERRALVEQGGSASLARQAQVLSRVEMAFPEPSATSMATQLSEFWAGWDDVANSPDAAGARAQVLELGATAAEGFNRAAAELDGIRDSALDQMTKVVSEVNGLAGQIAQLNGSVRAATAAGLQPNELMDRRDTLINDLAKLVGVTTMPGEHGTVQVSVSGTALVTGDRHQRLKVVELPLGSPTSGDPADRVGWTKVQVQWEGDSYPATMTGGDLHGLERSVNDILPRYLDELNTLSATLRNDVNAIHATGYGRDGVTGRDFFTATPAGPPYIGAAATLAITSGPTGVAGHPERIGSSGLASPAGNLDVTVAQRLAGLHSSPTGVDSAYQAFIGGLGVESQTINRRSAIQDQVTRQVDTSRMAASGVSIDEEMISLTQTQHAYNAAARLMTTIDSMIDTLVNRTGLVGR